MDERIQTTVNRFAAIGFFILWMLMILSVNYRLWILKQHPREYWDIIAIFCLGTLFVFIASARKGIFFTLSKWGLLGLCIYLFALFFITGKIHSVADLGGALIGLLLGMGLYSGILYFLNRRWQRKEGIEDEK